MEDIDEMWKMSDYDWDDEPKYLHSGYVSYNISIILIDYVINILLHDSTTEVVS